MKKQFNIPKGVTFGILLTLTLVIAVGATFSWYDRTAMDDVSTRKLTYSATGKITSNGAKTIETFLGTNENGVITYDDTALTADSSVNTLPGKVNYFKTVVTDNSNSGDSVISLYISDLKFSNNTKGSYHIGIVSPEKTYTALTGKTDSDSIVVNKVCLEDNLLVTGEGEVKTVEIYWFVEVDATDYTGGGTLNLGDFYYTFK